MLWGNKVYDLKLDSDMSCEKLAYHVVSEDSEFTLREAKKLVTGEVARQTIQVYSRREIDGSFRHFLYDGDERFNPEDIEKSKRSEYRDGWEYCCRGIPQGRELSEAQASRYLECLQDLKDLRDGKTPLSQEQKAAARQQKSAAKRLGISAEQILYMAIRKPDGKSLVEYLKNEVKDPIKLALMSADLDNLSKDFAKEVAKFARTVSQLASIEALQGESRYKLLKQYRELQDEVQQQVIDVFIANEAPTSQIYAALGTSQDEVQKVVDQAKADGRLPADKDDGENTSQPSGKKAEKTSKKPEKQVKKGDKKSKKDQQWPPRSLDSQQFLNRVCEIYGADNAQRLFDIFGVDPQDSREYGANQIKAYLKGLGLNLETWYDYRPRSSNKAN